VDFVVGERITVPYKGSRASAAIEGRVIIDGEPYVRIRVRGRGGREDIIQTIPESRLRQRIADGQVIRWNGERARLMGNRPPYEDGLVDNVWNNAKGPDGKVRDPNTGGELHWDPTRSRWDQWHMGHRSGHEYRTLVDRYVNGRITWDEFIAAYNNPNHYHPEHPIENMSHRHEAE
jgi:hypothetical protein